MLCLVVVFNDNGQYENLKQTDMQEVNISKDIPDVILQVFKKYNDDDNFNSCVLQNIDNCIHELVYEWKKEIKCDDFILETSKNACKQSEISVDAVEKKDLLLCNSLKSGKESCEYEVALAIGYTNYDTEICKSISEVYRISCYNQIIFAQSRNQKNVTICDKLLEENDDIDSEKEFCIQEVEYIIEEEKLREKEWELQ